MQTDAPRVEAFMLPDPITSGHIEIDDEGGATKRNRAPAGPAVHEFIAPHMARRQSIEPLWLTEKNAIEAAIEACGGNIIQAAGLLEVAPSTIYRKLQNWKKTRA